MSYVADRGRAHVTLLLRGCLIPKKPSRATNDQGSSPRIDCTEMANENDHPLGILGRDSVVARDFDVTPLIRKSSLGSEPEEKGSFVI